MVLGPSSLGLFYLWCEGWRVMIGNDGWMDGKRKIHHHAMIDRPITWCSCCLMKVLTFNAFPPTPSSLSQHYKLKSISASSLSDGNSHFNVWYNSIFLFWQQIPFTACGSMLDFTWYTHETRAFNTILSSFLNHRGYWIITYLNSFSFSVYRDWIIKKLFHVYI